MTKLIALALLAQSVSIQDNALQDWMRLKETMMKIAAAMPEDKFSYRATPAERTWGEQILHVAEANIVQMGRFGAKAPAPAYNMKATSRAEILRTLEASFDFGTAALKEQTDQTMLAQAESTRFDRFMGPSTKARVVFYVIGHTWDIYGQMVVYLRLNGITPPASQRF
ncbi:MAG TPA: DinB family protein [Vicinamibacterales bacterium]|nr:DinB family protein [Vicinamibacterales bacterium]